jgi:hypothetical protein
MFVARRARGTWLAPFLALLACSDDAAPSSPLPDAGADASVLDPDASSQPSDAGSLDGGGQSPVVDAGSLSPDAAAANDAAILADASDTLDAAPAFEAGQSNDGAPEPDDASVHCVEGDYEATLTEISSTCTPQSESFAVTLGPLGARLMMESLLNVDITTETVSRGCSARFSRTVVSKTGIVLEQLDAPVLVQTSDDTLEGEAELLTFESSLVTCLGTYRARLQRR